MSSIDDINNIIYTVQTWDIIKIKRLKEKSYDWVIDIIIYWNKIV